MASSDTVDVDLSGYKDRMGERVMPGRYLVVVEDTESDVSAQGNTMINVWLKVVRGEFSGSVILERLILMDKTLFRVVGFMQAIGLPTPKKKLRVNIRSWVGKSLEVDVDDAEPYMGRIKSQVTGYMSVRREAGTDGQVDAGDLDGLEEFSSDTTENPAQEEPPYGHPAPSSAEDVKSKLADQADTEDLEEAEDEIDLDKIEL